MCTIVFSETRLWDIGTTDKKILSHSKWLITWRAIYVEPLTDFNYKFIRMLHLLLPTHISCASLNPIHKLYFGLWSYHWKGKRNKCTLLCFLYTLLSRTSKKQIKQVLDLFRPKLIWKQKSLSRYDITLQLYAKYHEK